MSRHPQEIVGMGILTSHMTSNAQAISTINARMR
jgi:hypothetical protein